MVMSTDHGGVFDVLLRLVRFRLGGRAGNGRQFVSWIHSQDFVRTIFWLIAHEEMDGAVNLASPGPLPNAEFVRLLREAWGAMPFILKSRRVVPERLRIRNGAQQPLTCARAGAC